ncbi:hypothetical protein BAE44_0008675 [Dichanthelium oligosanthes]|uniref:F-box associated domain-containing protein n=1 Tax=Dichanthelium oligosanthes TaxID=888268 RepID=A0A1E5VYV4_9POAL|nr:hypothetical protein BAE44_0008675 [Dichanthelium oligosanthes]
MEQDPGSDPSPPAMSDPDAPSSDDAEQLRAYREAARRRLRERVGAIVRTIRAPLSDVIRDHALVHLPPAASARLRLVHPSWARALASPLFASAHAAAPRRVSGLFVAAPPAAGWFLPLDAADTVPSPSLAFLPASSAPAVLSSSHGVACCFSPADDAYFVCNPATESWEAVPCPPCRITWPRPAIVVVFDASVYNFGGDFTLVCAFESAPGSGIYCFAVFTSVTGAWWVADAVAPAEGLIPESGVAAGGMAWWRTTIGTAVGYNPVTGRVQLAVCPGDSAQWEIGSAAGRLHCAVRADGDVMVFRLDGHGGWEAAATISIAEILQRPWPPYPAYELTESDDDDAEAGNRAEQERTGAIAAVAANRFRMPGDDVRLLPFQGAEVEVVLLAGGRRVVAFDAVTRRWREAVLRSEPAGTDWGAAAYAAHTNTLVPIAPVVLMEPLDDQEAAS